MSVQSLYTVTIKKTKKIKITIVKVSQLLKGDYWSQTVELNTKN